MSDLEHTFEQAGIRIASRLHQTMVSAITDSFDEEMPDFPVIGRLNSDDIKVLMEAKLRALISGQLTIKFAHDAVSWSEVFRTTMQRVEKERS